MSLRRWGLLWVCGWPLSARSICTPRCCSMLTWWHSGSVVYICTPHTYICAHLPLYLFQVLWPPPGSQPLRCTRSHLRLLSWFSTGALTRHPSPGASAVPARVGLFFPQARTLKPGSLSPSFSLSSWSYVARLLNCTPPTPTTTPANPHPTVYA